MPTTKMPVWIRSEYVTIGQPPFPWIRGQKLPPVGGQPPAVCWQRQKQDTTFFAAAQPSQVSNRQALADLKKARPSREVTALVGAWGGCFFLLAIITAAISAVKHDRWTTFAVHLCADHPPNPKSTMENQKNDRMPFPDQDPNNA